MLARHPDVGFLSNVDDRFGSRNPTSRWNNLVYRAVPPSLTRKGRLRFAPSEGYRILDRQVSPMLSEPYRDLTEVDGAPWIRERIAAFFERRHRDQRKPVFVHKFTGWPRARLLDRSLEDTRFIHVIRDGRAVAASLIQMPWWSGFSGPENWRWGPLPSDLAEAWAESGQTWAGLAGIEWRILMDEHEKARAALPDDSWLDVRYEDILADPAMHFGEMLEFGGLNPSPTFDRALERQRFSTSRVASYRDDLSAHDLESLEQLIGDRLHRYGYS